MLSNRAQEISYNNENRCSKDRPEEITHSSAENDHEYHIAGFGPVKHVRKRRVPQEGVQSPCQPGKCARDRERHPLEQGGVISYTLRSYLIISNGEKGFPEGGINDNPDENGADNKYYEYKIIKI